MPTTGDPYPYAYSWQPSWGTSSAATTNVTWTYTDSTNGPPPSAPFVAVPVQPVVVEDDSPLGWLRAQVAEITDLASAA